MKREEKIARDLELRQEMDVSLVGEDDFLTCVGSSGHHKLSPIDKWTHIITLNQQRLNKELFMCF